MYHRESAKILIRPRGQMPYYKDGDKITYDKHFKDYFVKEHGHHKYKKLINRILRITPSPHLPVRYPHITFQEKENPREYCHLCGIKMNNFGVHISTVYHLTVMKSLRGRIVKINTQTL